MGDLRWGGTLIVTSRVYSQVYDRLTPGGVCGKRRLFIPDRALFWMNSAGKKLELFFVCLVTLYCVVCVSGVSGGGSAASKILMNQCLTFLVVYCPPLSKSDGWIEKDWMVDGEISRRT